MALYVKTRHGMTVRGEPEEIADDTSDEEIRANISAIAKVMKQPKLLTYLSLKQSDGALVIHPDDISHMTLHSPDADIVAMIQEIV